jgi:hypothetical protein
MPFPRASQRRARRELSAGSFDRLAELLRWLRSYLLINLFPLLETMCIHTRDTSRSPSGTYRDRGG